MERIPIADPWISPKEVDYVTRPHNRQAIENHELFPYITLIEGNSIHLSIVQRASLS